MTGWSRGMEICAFRTSLGCMRCSTGAHRRRPAALVPGRDSSRQGTAGCRGKLRVVIFPAAVAGAAGTKYCSS